MDRIRWKLSEFHKLLHFRDHMIGCGRHYSIEIPRRFPIHEISPPISAPGFDERKIATQPWDHHTFSAIEFPDFFAVRGLSTVSGRCEECGNARSACTNPL